MLKKVFYNTAKLGQATENPVIMPVSRLYIFQKIANNRDVPHQPTFPETARSLP
jgi:hypothetical protein